MSPCYFRYNFVYKQPIFIIFGNLILHEICNKVIYSWIIHKTWLVNLHYRVTVKHSQLLYKTVVKLCLCLHWYSEFVWAEQNRSGAGRKVTQAEQWSGVEKNEQSGACSGRSRSGEQRLQKWALMWSGKTACSTLLQCSARQSIFKLSTQHPHNQSQIELE